MDSQSLSHSRYNCTYYVVFIPKYRRKVMLGDLKKEVGEAISKVCKMEGVTIIKAATRQIMCTCMCRFRPRRAWRR